MDDFFESLSEFIPDGISQQGIIEGDFGDNVREFFGSELTDERILTCIQGIYDFFFPNVDMLIYLMDNPVVAGLSLSDDNFIMNHLQLMLKKGISGLDCFGILMTHDGAHRKLQGIDTGFSSHQEELCCDYMAGVRAGLNGMAEGEIETSLADIAENPSHTNGVLRIEAIEVGVAFAHDYLVAHNGVPPTFSDCLEHFCRLCNEN